MKFSLIVLAMISGQALATVYSYRDADGNLVYTDEPQGTQATEVVLPDNLTVLPALRQAEPDVSDEDAASDGTWVSWGSESGATVAPEAQEVSAVVPDVEILSPTAGEAYWSGGGALQVTVSVSPGLGADQELAVLLDGRELARGRANVLTLQGVDRGSHTLRVDVRDGADQRVATSGERTVHVLRPSIINRQSGLMHPSVTDAVRPETAVPAEAFPNTD
ncbi:MAG: DUF4124 domain-containing protein [Pseudomonadota bacterium]